MPVLVNRCEIYTAAILQQMGVISRSSGFKRFMKILARQNLIGDDALSRSHTIVQVASGRLMQFPSKAELQRH
jgi:hypothetical protein